MTDVSNPGWLERSIAQAEKDIASWPKQKKENMRFAGGELTYEQDRERKKND